MYNITRLQQICLNRVSCLFECFFSGIVDSSRTDLFRLNHSSGSSFVTTAEQGLGQAPPSPGSYQREVGAQLPNQMAAMGQMTPLQPIRTQGPAGHSNLLDMFDPLSDEMLTPPIRQGQVTGHMTCRQVT